MEKLTGLLFSDAENEQRGKKKRTKKDQEDRDEIKEAIIDSLKDEIRELQAHVDMHVQNNAVARRESEREVINLKEQLTDSDDRCCSLSDELSALRTKSEVDARTFEGELESLRKELEKVQKDSEKDRFEAARKLSESEGKRQSLKKAYLKLETHVEQLKASHKSDLSKIDSKYRDRLAQYAAEQDRKARDLNEELSEVRAKLEKAQIEKDGLLEAQKLAQAEHERSMKEKADDLRELAKERETELRKEVEEANSRFYALNNRMQESIARLNDTLVSERDARNKKEDELRHAIANSEKVNAGLRNHLESTEAAAADVRFRLAHSESELDDLRNDIARRCAEFEKIPITLQIDVFDKPRSTPDDQEAVVSSSSSSDLHRVSVSDDAQGSMGSSSDARKGALSVIETSPKEPTRSHRQEKSSSPLSLIEGAAALLLNRRSSIPCSPPKAPMVQPQVVELCDYYTSGPVFHKMPIYYCFTCGWLPENKAAICRVCVETCHKGHDTLAGVMSEAYCDCGSAKTGNCLAMEPHLRPYISSASNTRSYSNASSSSTGSSPAAPPRIKPPPPPSSKMPPTTSSSASSKPPPSSAAHAPVSASTSAATSPRPTWMRFLPSTPSDKPSKDGGGSGSGSQVLMSDSSYTVKSRGTSPMRTIPHHKACQTLPDQGTADLRMRLEEEIRSNELLVAKFEQKLEQVRDQAYLAAEGMRCKSQETDLKLAQQRNAFTDRERALEEQVTSKADVVFQYMQKYEEVESRCDALLRDCDTLRSKLRDQSRECDLSSSKVEKLTEKSQYYSSQCKRLRERLEQALMKIKTLEEGVSSSDRAVRQQKEEIANLLELNKTLHEKVLLKNVDAHAEERNRQEELSNLTKLKKVKKLLISEVKALRLIEAEWKKRYATLHDECVALKESMSPTALASGTSSSLMPSADEIAESIAATLKVSSQTIA